MNTVHLRKLAEAATPGPWFTETGGIYNATRGYLIVPTGDSEQDRADAAYIATASPDVVVRLLDAVSQLRTIADRMEAECKDSTCSHAWGIRYALTAVKEAIEDNR